MALDRQTIGGLSPLARGTLVSPPHRKRWCRFIPAGAGNTLSVTHSSNYQPVYPRWRGEHNERNNAQAFWSGLSPLARGTPNGSDVRRLRYRFIPAGAGNTATQCSNEPFDPVYPRWRGEHSTTAEGMKNLGGLSPLARGTHKPGADRQRRRRFIPAGAGNTMTRFLQPVSTPVYPRWRGEHLRRQIGIRVNAGLSPLARGTRP